LAESVLITVDPSIYKNYILTMLFLKYISGVWQDHYEAYEREHGDHPELKKQLIEIEAKIDGYMEEPGYGA
jgi:type I restriction enzyme M protein